MTGVFHEAKLICWDGIFLTFLACASLELLIHLISTSWVAGITWIIVVTYHTWPNDFFSFFNCGSKSDLCAC
jgi:hypothetical protein